MRAAHMAKKKKHGSIGVALLIVSLVLACGSAVAYMFAKTDVTANSFEKAAVSCSVQEIFDGVEKSSIAVRNTSNIPTYLRVRLVSYWVNEQGEVMAKPSELPEFTPAAGWVAQGRNTWCYCGLIGVGETTPNLLADGSAMALRKEDGYFQVVEVFADAIQGEPAEAVKTSWNVTVDENGVITGAQSTG